MCDAQKYLEALLTQHHAMHSDILQCYISSDYFPPTESVIYVLKTQQTERSPLSSVKSHTKSPILRLLIPSTFQLWFHWANIHFEVGENPT